MRIRWPRSFGLAELGGVIGLCTLIRGVWMIYPPASYIVGGVVLFVLCWFAAKLDSRKS